MGGSVGFDFFRDEIGAAPVIGEGEAADVARRVFAVAGTARAIGSQQDTNFFLDGQGGPLAVLKFAHPVFGAEEVAAQDAAADALAEAAPGLRIATVLRGAGGERLAARVATSGGLRVARLLRFLPGGNLGGSAYLPPRTVAALGRVAGRASAALRDFTHPGLDRVLQWDPRHADRALPALAAEVPSSPLRDAALAAAEEAWERLAAVSGDLPLQAVHLDITDDNTVCDAAGLPDGVIDFGDLALTWGVAELASTVASVLHHASAEPHTVLPAVRAFHSARPLSAAEAEALWPLVVLRGAVLVLSGAWQSVIDAGNAYAMDALDDDRRIFERALAVPAAVMSGVVRDALGLPAAPFAVPGTVPLLAGPFARLDLSPDADALDEGAWLRPGIEAELAAESLAASPGGVATHHARPRLTAARVLSDRSPATVPTGMDVWPGRDAEAVAPFPGRLSHTDEGFVLRDALTELVVTCDDAVQVAEEGEVKAGDALLTVRAGVRLHAALRRAGSPKPPKLVRPEYAQGWLALTADPSPLFGLSPSAPVDDPTLLARRQAALADVQEHYYDEPPRIERGWRHHLVADDGRVYLDMVNNVAVAGHAHPGIERAASRQLRRLNTNSRFHYASVVEYAERLAALLPEPLDTVFLVNSGSEAADLALRLAFAATGRHDVVAVREAYHGWTYASDAVSTSIADNPDALATRPPWVHTVDAPNPYRGRHRDGEAYRYGPEAAAFIDALAAEGRPPAAFIAEPFYGNAGGVPLPDGYLAEVYAAVRRHGGLAIADEVQVGYGRLGAWFWGFEQQEVVPDVVTVAKAAGNGHPLGAVVTTREIAERYRTQGYFFSSTGGSPVSSVIGTAVLDVIAGERLQQNAAEVGGLLIRGMRDLAARHPAIGAVHGSGLYLGLELVEDRATREPATRLTAALCDHLRDLGVIMQPTGDHLNILKIKPPLCLDADGAAFFLAAADRALGAT
ncbi:hydroxylysine kinase /5-phosphonooxy-L-lysine phospho-lyase [Actinocorallia herbida]|uniref:Hydroxylysine kinase /5-phosphonooxy-L-lysine phospho-lyase n=1 Tax=Actinocorallia herbida TaxID=58109 RepID=A0A3N1CT57_9ACTN|nr:aminotransferase [Actinocorallia herbida]ROO84486.1 hydroxylysine kinase /5-phosphonooxy-L-lysine phospho-lyase [Actinocorallia herbida]